MIIRVFWDVTLLFFSGHLQYLKAFLFRFQHSKKTLTFQTIWFWRWRHYSQEHWELLAQSHSIMQRRLTFISITVRTSDFMYCVFYKSLWQWKYSGSTTWRGTCISFSDSDCDISFIAQWSQFETSAEESEGNTLQSDGRGLPQCSVYSSDRWSCIQ